MVTVLMVVVALLLMVVAILFGYARHLTDQVRIAREDADASTRERWRAHDDAKHARRERDRLLDDLHGARADVRGLMDRNGRLAEKIATLRVEHGMVDGDPLPVEPDELPELTGQLEAFVSGLDGALYEATRTAAREMLAGGLSEEEVLTRLRTEGL